MDEPAQRAFDDGYQAFEDGKAGTCPYQGEAESRDWAAGWIEALHSSAVLEPICPECGGAVMHAGTDNADFSYCSGCGWSE